MMRIRYVLLNLFVFFASQHLSAMSLVSLRRSIVHTPKLSVIARTYATVPSSIQRSTLLAQQVLIRKYSRDSASEKDLICKMPSAEVIRERFKGFEHFLEKTNFAESIANQELHPLGVVLALTFAMHDYHEYLAKSLPPHLLVVMQTTSEMHRPFLLELLLQDHKGALEELQKAGLYEPMSKRDKD